MTQNMESLQQEVESLKKQGLYMPARGLSGVKKTDEKPSIISLTTAIRGFIKDKMHEICDEKFMDKLEKSRIRLDHPYISDNQVKISTNSMSHSRLSVDTPIEIISISSSYSDNTYVNSNPSRINHKSQYDTNKEISD